MIFVTVMLFWACSNPENKTTNIDANSNDVVQATSSSVIPDTNSSGIIPENMVHIEFDELTVLLEDIEMGWNDMSSPDDKLYKADSIAYFNLYPGDWMYDKYFQIKEPEYEPIELYVQIVNHVTIDTERLVEVPVCVLTGWKNYTSNWIPVPIKNGVLKFDSQVNIEEAPIEYSLEELKAAVNEMCGEAWLNDIDQIQSEKNLPVSVFTSQYNYKIVARNTITGKTIERFIVFYTPVTC